MPALQRHIETCNDMASLAGLVPWRIGPARVGWLTEDMSRRLRSRRGAFDAHGGDGLELVSSEGFEARSRALGEVVAHLAAAGVVSRRDEAFDVRADPDSEALARLDRGALSALGVISQGVHVNGRVRRPDGLHLWVGWRSKHKSVAPGRLDNLVAGGVPAGLTPMQTLLKEAAEEASMPPELAARARQVSRVSYRMTDGPGIRRDVLHCFDLELPEDFTPVPGDDEVERYELWPVGRVLEAVRDTPDVKFNVNLVLIDLFLREGLVDPGSEEGKRLRAGLDPGP
jgi:8-oxo-dGTP pyrophosphatase MutT (NUDIX family)